MTLPGHRVDNQMQETSDRSVTRGPIPVAHQVEAPPLERQQASQGMNIGGQLGIKRAAASQKTPETGNPTLSDVRAAEQRPANP